MTIFFNALRLYGIFTSLLFSIAICYDIIIRIDSKNAERFRASEHTHIPIRILLIVTVSSLISSIVCNYTFADAINWHDLSIEPDGNYIYYVDYTRYNSDYEYIDSGRTVAKILISEDKYYIKEMAFSKENFHKTVKTDREEISLNRETLIVDQKGNIWGIELINQHAECFTCTVYNNMSCPTLTDDERSSAFTTTVVSLRIVATIYFLYLLWKEEKS